MSTSPTKLNKYKVLGFLGAGGMSQVFHAIDVDSGQEVVIKLLREDVRSKGELRSRFKREIELGLDLLHPGIIRILDQGESNRGPYYVMPFAQGVSLKTLQEEQGALGLGGTLSIAIQCADGLAAIHEEVVIHRDVKPDNILISDDDRVTLMDFGLCRPEDATLLTGDGKVLGTPRFLAPEQLLNAENTSAIDIHALALTIWSLLSGYPPYRECANLVSIYTAKVKDGPLPLGPLKDVLGPRLSSLIEAMLDLDPRNRPTGTDVFEVLARAFERDFPRETKELLVRRSQSRLSRIRADRISRSGERAAHIIRTLDLNSSPEIGPANAGPSPRNSSGARRRASMGSRGVSPGRASGRASGAGASRATKSDTDLSGGATVPESANDSADSSRWNPRAIRRGTLLGLLCVLPLLVLGVFLFRKTATPELEGEAGSQITGGTPSPRIELRSDRYRMIRTRHFSVHSTENSILVWFVAMEAGRFRIRVTRSGDPHVRFEDSPPQPLKRYWRIINKLSPETIYNIDIACEDDGREFPVEKTSVKTRDLDLQKRTEASLRDLQAFSLLQMAGATRLSVQHDYRAAVPLAKLLEGELATMDPPAAAIVLRFLGNIGNTAVLPLLMDQLGAQREPVAYDIRILDAIGRMRIADPFPEFISRFEDLASRIQGDRNQIRMLSDVPANMDGDLTTRWVSESYLTGEPIRISKVHANSRECLIRSLKATELESARPLLLRIARLDIEDVARRAALTAAASVGRSGLTVSALRSFFDGPLSDTAAAAAGLSPEVDVVGLLPLVDQIRDGPSRIQLFEVLGQSGCQDVVELIEKALMNAQPIQARSLVWALGGVPGPGSLALLQKLADQKIQALGALALALIRREDRAGLPLLLSLAGTTTDPLESAHATYGLCWYGHPKAFDNLVGRLGSNRFHDRAMAVQGMGYLDPSLVGSRLKAIIENPQDDERLRALALGSFARIGFMNSAVISLETLPQLETGAPRILKERLRMLRKSASESGSVPTITRTLHEWIVPVWTPYRRTDLVLSPGDVARFEVDGVWSITPGGSDWRIGGQANAEEDHLSLDFVAIMDGRRLDITEGKKKETPQFRPLVLVPRTQAGARRAGFTTDETLERLSEASGFAAVRLEVLSFERLPMDRELR